ncbi:DNA polymerase III, subunit gamma and tau [Candidatus Amesbacteria bacterium RIFCSPHIGHO2_01_FULL_48_32]|uniref:DNA polymerase III subunit gamma/tau n=1 Tax=Candidatus Amesbacteria bacterium RIFCSPLOWO2_01_FULL_48_25 TaxID=1797259 RepID=A0A1F4ZBU5_9BACT|nr:MAG: DNA polymerase III, subunit gamma and tau [Candidatus Amesbacteria bacterium RIFCSPHIGHO2_01_FULL_48_32]OGD03668.1 MAG: DNA polymerase III, subunit gamma and tau [Candidatus Amesbacteria bacterium RIFCSPLOWO2_01_FULL_48_25]
MWPMTLYLKYRPQTVPELDLKAVRESLGKTLSNKDLPAGRQSLPHAWLFSGPRGVGKTSAARVLAKYINCRGKEKPCNKCDLCLGITAGACPDVVEIDAASNRGIDEIRQLREGVGLAPMQAKFKVYIIDEVHMLTSEAANALLKTLEEPPPHVMFVLCTTEAEKLPETVISRCTRVVFSKPSLEEIVEKLKRVAGEEKLKVDHGQLILIAKAARGSFRDAIKMLEQVMLGGKLDEIEGAGEFLEMGTDEALAYVNKLAERGVNLRTFVEKCVEELREKLLETKDVSLISKIEELERAYGRMKDAAVPQLPLEIFVIERAGESKSIRAGGEKKSEGPTIKKQEPVVGGNLGGHMLDDVLSHWPEVMKAVRPKNHSVEALLRSTKPVGFDGRDLILEAFYEFHKKQLETERCRVIVEQTVSEVLGVDVVALKMQLGHGSTVAKATGGDGGEELVKAAEEIFKR